MKLIKLPLTFIKLTLVTILISATPFLAHSQQQSISDLIDRATTAGIAPPQIEHLQNHAELRGISQNDLINIIGPAVTMAENNLPWDMVFKKAFEGMSKGINAQQMIPVLESIAEHSGRSADIVDPWMNRPEVGRMLDRTVAGMDRNNFRNEMVRVGTKTLSGNFDRTVLEQTFATIAEDGALENIKPSGVLAAINVLSDLPTAAQEPTATAQIVLRALQGGFEAGELQLFAEAMNASQRRNQLPASAIADGLSQQLMGGTPAAQILQNMFNGKVGGGFPGNVPPGINRERVNGGRR